ncbi:TetR/AcrR family transcriptional regulator [Sphingobium sp. CR2-8]|uniref:TetR/AcrR family transcriptional regulator n=1 Tax=Sphingobium sp. CR2-8 TaxID=1306534 RepID=UPI002DBE0186|nr:TetR/AcrR family transcriptional regulator [Sphingobium sp. CR2-8]MEC3909139.1 TetR/AcrR family transcriptional regulator [Sphingobium sp. CR2-8]
MTLRRAERHKRRRTQILDAARACVRLDGFHAASMSRICAEASMSVGHVYKYFETKEAIMIALVERDFEEFMEHVTRLRGQDTLDADQVINEFLNDILWLLDYDRAALSLEILAEAARNPKFAALVARVDRQFREEARKFVAPLLEGLAEDEIDVRTEMLLVITRAFAIHVGTHPTRDPKFVSGCELVLRSILLPPAPATPV